MENEFADFMVLVAVFSTMFAAFPPLLAVLLLLLAALSTLLATLPTLLAALPKPLTLNKLFTKTIKNVYLRNRLHLLEVTDLHLKGDLQ